MTPPREPPHHTPTPGLVGSPLPKIPQQVVVVTTKFLQVLGVPGEVICRDRRDDETPHLLVEILTPDSGLLIGEYGKTLRAVEHVLRLVLRSHVGDAVRVMVDVNAYRVRQMDALRQRARIAAQRARMTGRAVPLKPMNPADRRVVHLALATEECVETESQGEASARRVIVRPKDPRI